MSNKDDVVQLNVGGKTEGFMVRTSVLTQIPDSPLEAMFSGRHTLPMIDGKVFVDRDPSAFLKVVNYLRNNQ